MNLELHSTQIFLLFYNALSDKHTKATARYFSASPCTPEMSQVSHYHGWLVSQSKCINSWDKSKFFLSSQSRYMLKTVVFGLVKC